MAIWQYTILALYSCLILVAVIRHITLKRYLNHAPNLNTSSPRIKTSQAPRVSILVPAKDEEQTIAGCLQTLCALNYPDYEILIVDDRSEDRTAEIVRDYARRDDRIRLIQVESLPEGWTGKTHALQYAQRFATGDWLLFVDADTSHHPDTLSITVQHALDNQLDMLSALPKLECRSFWERVIQPYASTCLVILYPLSRANDHQQLESAWANGQFILVSREAYDGLGQHTAVRDKFVEDIALAKCARRSGYRLNIVVASALFSVRMYSDLGQIIRGWSRIFYSAVDCHAQRLVTLLGLVMLLGLTPYAVMLGSGLALTAGASSMFMQVLCGMGVLHEALQLTLYARIYPQTRTPRAYVGYRCLSVLAMGYILLRTIRMCQTHEVSWRGTQYSSTLQNSTGLGSVYLTAELDTNDAPNVEAA